MKKVKEAREEAYEELSKPEYKELREAMLRDILEIAKERLEQLREENE